LETGTYISGIGHVALIGWAVIGGPLFDGDPPDPPAVTEVAILSVSEFEALRSDAPSVEAELLQPTTGATDDSAPETPAEGDRPNEVITRPPDNPQLAGNAPDLSLANRNFQANAQTDAPDLADQSTTVENGATLIVPNAQISNRDQTGRNQPDQLAMMLPEARAPRIDSTPSPEPEPDATPDPETKTETAPDLDATDPADEAVDTAPDQSATKIVTEADEQAETAAPERSSRPKGRPAQLAEKDAEARAIAEALAAAQAEEQARGVTRQNGAGRTAPPMSEGEISAIRTAIGDKWNTGSLSAEALLITVTVGFSLDPEGRPMMESFRMINATDGSAAARQSAYDAARRAIVRAANNFQLDPAKYDSWKEMELTFNPEKMRIK